MKGKKLGFVSQEIGREINTIGSKANNASLQKEIVQMKDALERIKEQLLYHLMTKGKCVVLSAHQEVEKQTWQKDCFKTHSPACFFDFATSRKPINEKDGVDYFFIKPQSFKEQIDKESFEYEEAYPEFFMAPTLRSGTTGVKENMLFSILTLRGVCR